MDKKGAFRLKAITGIIAAVAFLTGFLLIDRGGISGNTVVTSEPTISAISVMGLIFVFLSVILAAYSIKR